MFLMRVVGMKLVLDEKWFWDESGFGMKVVLG